MEHEDSGYVDLNGVSISEETLDLWKRVARRIEKKWDEEYVL